MIRRGVVSPERALEMIDYSIEEKALLLLESSRRGVGLGRQRDRVSCLGLFPVVVREKGSQVGHNTVV